MKEITPSEAELFFFIFSAMFKKDRQELYEKLLHIL